MLFLVVFDYIVVCTCFKGRFGHEGCFFPKVTVIDAMFQGFCFQENWSSNIYDVFL